MVDNGGKLTMTYCKLKIYNYANVTKAKIRRLGENVNQRISAQRNRQNKINLNSINGMKNIHYELIIQNNTLSSEENSSCML